MSAGKYTRVPTPEERIAQLEKERVNNEQRNNQLQAEIRRQQQLTTDRLQQQEKMMREQEQKHSRVIDSLESDIKEAAISHQNAIRNVQDTFDKTIKKQNDDFNKAIQEQGEDLTKQIKDVRYWTKKQLETHRKEMLEITQEQQRQLDVERNRVDAIFAQKQQNVSAAQARLRDLDKLITSFDKEYPHQKYAPGELERIKANHQDAKKALNQGMEQAAWAQTQATFNALMILQERVLTAQIKFETTYEQTIRALDTILQTIRKQQNVKVEERERLVDDWTDGAYSKLGKEIEETINDLETKKQSLTIEEVQEKLGMIASLEEQQVAIVKKAINSILASRERETIAKNIAIALDKSGYRIIDGNGYENDDPRGVYLVKAKIANVENGSEILVIVDPQIVNDQIQNVLHTEFIRSHFPDDNSRRIQHEKVVSTLKGIGIEVGNTTCVSEKLEGVENIDVKKVTKAGNSMPQNVKDKIQNRK